MSARFALKSVARKILRSLGLRRREFDDRMRIFLTLECNLSCPYCVNRHWPERYAGDSYDLLTPSAWIDIINKAGRTVVLTGGEPFLYSGLPELVNGIRRDLEVLVYTNLTISPEDFVSQVTRPVRFYVSYHPCGGPVAPFIENLKCLAQRRDFSGTAHSIGWARQKAAVAKARRSLRRLPWEFVVDPDQYELFPDMCGRQNRRKVRCAGEVILVAPDGIRYPCVTLLLQRRMALEDLREEPLRGDHVEAVCDNWGHCAPCDGLSQRKIEFSDGPPPRASCEGS